MDYVTGDDAVTTQVIAERYGVRPETVRRWCSKHKWAAQRAQYRHMATQRGMEKASTTEAEIRARHINLGKTVQGIAMVQLTKLRNPRVKEIVGGDGKASTKVIASLLEEQMDAPEVRRWLETGIKIEREAAGLEEEIRVRLESEVETILRKLQGALTTDAYRQVLNVLSIPDGSS